MDFQIFSKALQTIVSTIENSTIASVRSLKAHTYPVRVTNQVNKVQVSGTVVVGNQRNLEAKVVSVEKAIKSVDKSVKEEAKLERAVRVLNFPKELDLSRLEKGDIKSHSLIEKLIKVVQSLHFPTKLEITNQIDTTSEIKRVVGAVADVERAVKGLRLDPKITVQPPERLIVPPAQVTVEKTEIDYEKLASLIPQPEPIDYQKMAEVIGKEIAGMIVTVGGSRSRAGNSSRVTNGQEFVNNRYVDGVITYYGSQRPNGDWLIRKDDATDLNNMIETYASIKNNPSVSTYTQAWNNRTSLTYGIYSATI